MAKGDVILPILNNDWTPAESTLELSTPPNPGDAIVFFSVINEAPQFVEMDEEIAELVGDTGSGGGSEWLRVQMFARIVAEEDEPAAYTLTSSAGGWFEAGAFHIAGPFASIAELTVALRVSAQVSGADLPVTPFAIGGDSRVLVVAAADGGPTISFTNSFAGSKFNWLNAVHRAYSSGTAQTTMTWAGGEPGSGLMAVLSIASTSPVISDGAPVDPTQDRTPVVSFDTDTVAGNGYTVASLTAMPSITAAQIVAGTDASNAALPTSQQFSGAISSGTFSAPQESVADLATGTWHFYSVQDAGGANYSNILHWTLAILPRLGFLVDEVYQANVTALVADNDEVLVVLRDERGGTEYTPRLGLQEFIGGGIEIATGVLVAEDAGGVAEFYWTEGGEECFAVYDFTATDLDA